MPDIKNEDDMADQSHDDMVIEISREEFQRFQARKKRQRLEEKRNNASTMIFTPNIKIKGSENAVAEQPTPSSPDSERIIEVSKEDHFQARNCKKRRIEEDRSKRADGMPFTSSLFAPDILKEENSIMDMKNDLVAPAPTPTPPPGEPNMFTPYIFQSESLGQDIVDVKDLERIDYWKDNISPRQRLRFVLKKIFESKVNHALAILAENKVRSTPNPNNLHVTKEHHQASHSNPD